MLGKNVRYNGGNKLEPLIIEILQKTFEDVEFVPVCPEVEAGFPVPREPVRLEGLPRSPRMISINTRIDITDRIRDWTEKQLTELAKEELHGFILKSRSPSCAMERSDVYTAGDRILPEGIGIFARAFMEKFPHIPVIDEVNFRDETSRTFFIEALKNRRSEHEDG